MQKIINNLVYKLNKPIPFFLNGGCLIFAKELQNIVGGEILYLKEEAHVVLKLNNKLFDASGNVTNIYKNSSCLNEKELLERPKILKSLSQNLY